MFDQAFKNIDDVLWKEAGCTTELDYTEQTSWLLFLKYLDGLEQDKAAEATLEGRTYTFILEAPYRWDRWAAPKGRDGKLDHNAALTGDDLRDFVNQRLFPYLHGFKLRAGSSDTIEYKIGEIFGEIKNKISSGYNLREIIDHIDALHFDVILANPPFGGKERKEVQQNFPIRTGESAFLFLQHFIKILRAGGRAGVVIKNTFLSNTDAGNEQTNNFVALRALDSGIRRNDEQEKMSIPSFLRTRGPGPFSGHSDARGVPNSFPVIPTRTGLQTLFSPFRRMPESSRGGHGLWISSRPYTF